MVSFMVTVQKPKICLSEKAEYDPKTGKYYAVMTRKFQDEEELITFLAVNQKPAYNWKEEPVSGRYENRYLDCQALAGIPRNYYEGNAFYPSLVCILFWLDTPGKPILNVRRYREAVTKKYLLLLEEKGAMYQAWEKLVRRPHLPRQGRRRHQSCCLRGTSNYIQRARLAYGLLADEEEYRVFSKPKDRAFKCIWPDEDFARGRHGNGWKDNSGNRYRHQWEAKACRKYKKQKRLEKLGRMEMSQLLGY